MKTQGTLRSTLINTKLLLVEWPDEEKTVLSSDEFADYRGPIEIFFRAGTIHHPSVRYGRNHHPNSPKVAEYLKLWSQPLSDQQSCQGQANYQRFPRCQPFRRIEPNDEVRLYSNHPPAFWLVLNVIVDLVVLLRCSMYSLLTSTSPSTNPFLYILTCSSQG